MLSNTLKKIVLTTFLALAVSLAPIGFKWDGSVQVDQNILDARSGGGPGGAGSGPGGAGGGPGGPGGAGSGPGGAGGGPGGAGSGPGGAGGGPGGAGSGPGGAGSGPGGAGGDGGGIGAVGTGADIGAANNGNDQNGNDQNGDDPQGNQGEVTSAAAKDDSTTGLGKAMSVVGTTPASEYAMDALQTAVDRQPEMNDVDDQNGDDQNGDNSE